MTKLRLYWRITLVYCSRNYDSRNSEPAGDARIVRESSAKLWASRGASLLEYELATLKFTFIAYDSDFSGKMMKLDIVLENGYTDVDPFNFDTRNYVLVSSYSRNWRKVKKKVTLLSSTCLISRQLICGFDSFSSLQTLEIFKVSDWSGMPRTREKGCTTIPEGREKQIADEYWRSSVISAKFYS